ncbi:MAG: SMC-Scp complex subunit ScpB [Planctomycetota bacterium]
MTEENKELLSADDGLEQQSQEQSELLQEIPNDIEESAGDSDDLEKPIEIDEEIQEQDSEDQDEHDLEGEPELEEDFEVTAETVVEAILFASDEPLTPARLAKIAEIDTRQIRQHITNLNNKYRANKNAFRIEKIAGGFQMLTLSPYNYWLKKLLTVRSDNKLSPAALETLAIIAYKQPIIRADIEAVRGVAAGEMIRNLMYKGLVKIVGRAEILGRPILYGTTKKFLEVFGLNSLKDLPKIEELKNPES